MNDFSLIIAIVIFIVSILQIILFFKLWKMTNDAAEINKTVSSMKVSLDGFLSRKLPEEERIHAAFVEVFGMLWSQNVVNINQLPSSEPERTVELKKQLVDIFDLNKQMFNNILKKNFVNNVYVFDKLKEDIINHYQKKMDELQ